MAESILLSFFAYLIALGFVYLALPFFNSLSGKQLLFSAIINYKVILVSLAFVSLVGLLAGTYPAFFLSSFNSVFFFIIFVGIDGKGKIICFIQYLFYGFEIPILGLRAFASDEDIGF